MRYKDITESKTQKEQAIAEDATAGATSAASVATVVAPIGAGKKGRKKPTVIRRPKA
jgi:hypothetical protein